MRGNFNAPLLPLESIRSSTSILGSLGALISIQTSPRSSFSFLVFGTRRDCKQIHSQNKSSRGTIIKHREIRAEYITAADNYHCKRQQMRKMQNYAPGTQMLNPHPLRSLWITFIMFGGKLWVSADSPTQPGVAEYVFSI